jgi:hypothetical protein
MNLRYVKSAPQTGCTVVTFKYMVYIISELITRDNLDMLGGDAASWGEEFLVF